MSVILQQVLPFQSILRLTTVQIKSIDSALKNLFACGYVRSVKCVFAYLPICLRCCIKYEQHKVCYEIHLLSFFSSQTILFTVVRFRYKIESFKHPGCQTQNCCQ